MNASTCFEAAVIGAGASGMAAAIFLGRAGIRTLLLEKKVRGGAKLLMSGGGHCNITHQTVSEKDYGTGQPKTVRNILRSFKVDQTFQFFESIGIPLIQEPGGKCFPATKRAQDVLEAMMREIERLGICVKTSAAIHAVKKEEHRFLISGEGIEEKAESVLLCTGGLSYPQSGSDGSGFKMAAALGHRVMPLVPALVPLTTNDSDWHELAGISLPVTLSFFSEKIKIHSVQDEFLFTHFGFSGPAILDLSRFWNRALKIEKPRIEACFLPAQTEECFEKEGIHQTTRHPKLSVKKFLSRFLPERLSEVLLLKAGISAETTLAHWTKDSRRKLMRILFHYDLPVQGSLGYEKAEVTAGGIDLEELDSKTLESNLIAGLFFAGEILDCDGRLGGFNFQWAWASAWSSTQGIIRKLRSQIL